MAKKRMFNIKITDSDAFLDMPLSAQCLYFHLNMHADDDGFIGNPKKISRMIGASEDDLKLLILKRFVLMFEDSVLVIKHWLIHNTLRKDRYQPTIYTDEKDRLGVKENNAYTLDMSKSVKKIENGNQMATKWQPVGTTDIDIGIDIDKDIVLGNSNSICTPPTQKKQKHKYGSYSHVLLDDEQYESLKTKYGEEALKQHIQILDEYCESSGKRYKNYAIVIQKWVHDKWSKEYVAGAFSKNEIQLDSPSETIMTKEELVAEQEYLQELLEQNKKEQLAYEGK